MLITDKNNKALPHIGLGVLVVRCKAFVIFCQNLALFYYNKMSKEKNQAVSELDSS